MALRVRDVANTLRTITGLRVRDAGNVLRVIQVGRVRDAGNVQRIFFNSMTVTVNPADVFGTEGTFDPQDTVISGGCAVTVVGGLPPFTYAWARVVGDPAITATFPTSYSTNFSAIVDAGDTISAVFECLVTDASGAKKYVHVDVTLTCVDWD